MTTASKDTHHVFTIEKRDLLNKLAELNGYSKITENVFEATGGTILYITQRGFYTQIPKWSKLNYAY